VHRIRRRDGFSRGPDRDTPRNYVALGLIFAGLVLAGVLVGVLDEDATPAVLDVTPTAIPNAPAPPAGATPTP